MKDDARSGRPSTARTDENVESVRRLLTEDRHTTLQMIADRLNIGKETVRRIVTEDLGKRKICARFVPDALATEQKQERVVYCRDFVLMGQDECFGKISLPVTKHGVSPMIRPPNDRPQRGWGKTLQNHSKIANEDDVNCFFRRRRCNSSRVCP